MTAIRYSDFEQAKADGIKYMLAVGRRQPMHQGHLKTIQRIMEQGFTPIIVIGSTNTAEKVNGLADPLFEPVSNPLTLEQQREQIRLSLPGKVEGKDYHLVPFPDLGDNEKWNQTLIGTLKGQIEIDGKYPNLLGQTAFHFIGKPEDKRPRRLVSADGKSEEVLAYFWEDTFEKLALPVLNDSLHEEVPAELSATSLRSLDINHLSDADRALFAAPDYVVEQAKAARDSNPDKALLIDIPVTAFDLTLQRLAQEKKISTAEIIAEAKKMDSVLTLTSLQNAARTLNGSMRKFVPTVPLKIASASLNQTVYDFATNVPNILSAIDKAVADGADVLALEELGLTGYSADDYHQWNKNNDEVWKHIQLIARYAQSKNPNLIISLGTPWHYADKTAHASDAAYNLNNRPYNTQMTISGGKVLAIAAKSILADGPAEYEPRQFRNWPFEKGTVPITLPDGNVVPFGKPIVSFGKDGQRFTLTHEICADGWPGVNDNLTINAREQAQARHIVKQSKTHDLSVVLNPSASKPEPALNKEKIRAEGLCKQGSKYCGAFVYTNYLGSSSGTYAAEGSQIFAQDGKIIHHGKRYHFGDVSYSSAVIDVPLAERGAPDVVAPHEYRTHDALRTGQEAAFEKHEPEQLAIEEYARSISLWLRDYMRKQSWPCQGFVISLSGGKDSAYGAIAVTTMVELEVKENGIAGFFEHFPNLKYKDDVLRIEREQGQEAAIDAIKKNLLTCVYLPTENSSARTENAARFLIEGGALPGGTNVKGIGGTFYVAPKQRVLDEETIAYSGLNVDAVARSHRAIIIDGMDSDASVKDAIRALPETLQYDIAAAEIVRRIKAYVNAEKGSNPKLPDYITQHCVKPIPTWANPDDDVTLQNIQARVRLPTPWTVANKESKLALVTSNKSEAALGYTTAGGDMHMGGANPIGGIGKNQIIKSLKYFAEHGLEGLHPIPSLHFVNQEKASAELRKEVEGTPAQTDESDLGFSYAQSKVIEQLLITDRRTPAEVFAALKGNTLFPSDETARRDILLKFSQRWGSSQFKRIMGTLAPHVGGNNDPHQAVRTTVLGDHFRTGMAQVTLDVMADKLGGPGPFERAFQMRIDDAKELASLSAVFKSLLLGKSIPELLSPDLRSDVKAASRTGKAAEAYIELTPQPRGRAIA